MSNCFKELSKSKALLKLHNVPPKPKKVSEFIKWYFDNLSPATILVSTGRQQCRAGKRRSFSDLYLLCKYYYPSITVKSFAKSLIKVTSDTSNSICGQYCSVINKYVISNSTYYSKFINKQNLGIIGLTKNIGKDGISGEKILNFIKND